MRVTKETVKEIMSWIMPTVVIIFGLAVANSCTVVAQDSRLETDKKVLAQSKTEAEVRARAEEIKRQKELDKAKRELMKEDTSEMKQARRELQQEADRERKLANDRLRMYNDAQVMGCDPHEMGINPDAVEFSNMRVMTTVRIHSGSNITYTIQTPARRIGVAVEKLCGGGWITLAFARDIWTGSEYESIPLVASGVDLRGRTVTRQMTLSLSAYNIRYRRVDARIWELP